jgi:hypothetical protein
MLTVASRSGRGSLLQAAARPSQSANEAKRSGRDSAGESIGTVTRIFQKSCTLSAQKNILTPIVVKTDADAFCVHPVGGDFVA